MRLLLKVLCWIAMAIAFFVFLLIDPHWIFGVFLGGMAMQLILLT